jgi:hypothetical protein
MDGSDDLRLDKPIGLLGLPTEVLKAVCLKLDLLDLVRVAETCKRFRYGDPETCDDNDPLLGSDIVETLICLEVWEQPHTGSPVIAALLLQASPGGQAFQGARPAGRGSESWISFLARCARQRRCRETPPIALALADRGTNSLFVDAAGRLRACGLGSVAGHGDMVPYYDPTLVAAMAGVCVHSVAAGTHSLTSGWDGQVYSWARGVPPLVVNWVTAAGWAR